MCGINGILRLGPEAPAIDREELVRTRDTMAVRGPDGAGEWIAPDGRAGLGHRRLAILDLSAAGAQPMTSPDDRFHIVLNGEIYNFRELRRELAGAGVAFRSQSDTEVLLALYAREGARMLPRLRGMYALAIWDEAAKELLLARDPHGIKPLYYATEGGLLRFASQVKALERSGGISLAIDPAGLAGFLLWGSVPEPWTIRRAVRALPAGTYLKVLDGAVEAPQRHARAESDTTEASPAGRAGAGASTQRPIPGAPTAAGRSEGSGRWSTPAMAAADAVTDSVRAHLVSDVPVAIFLSAGLDSALVAALACRHLSEPPATFTLSFDALAGTPLDEAPLAAEVARRLGTRHLERRVGRADFLGLWDEAVAAMDQPSIDGFNTFLVSRVAHREGIKVALSGLGGDELLGGYSSFTGVPRAVRLARWGRRLPGLAGAWPALAGRLAPERPKLAGLFHHGSTLPGAYFLRRALFLPEELPGLLGRDLAEEGLAGYDAVAETTARLAEANGHAADPWRAVHHLETAQYMRNQLLRDSDWAAMASSLELRVPLVDAWLSRQLAGIGAGGFEPARSGGKAALVRAAAPELPEALFHRRKTGFYAPVTEWLDGEARNGASGERMGGRSRRLARRVLAELGIALEAG